MKPSALLAAAAALTLAGAAQAQMRMPSADADGDGLVSRAENTAATLKRFQRMDQNGDGVIDKAEIEQMRQMGPPRPPGDAPKAKGPGPRGMGETMFKAADTNKDGKISKAEFTAQAKARFDKADRNGDGKLDAAEREAMRPPGAPPPR